MNQLENLHMQRAGLIAIICGVLEAPCSEPEAMALKMATIDTVIKVVNAHPVGDAVEMRMMNAGLKFADDGIAQEEALRELKAVLGGE